MMRPARAPTLPAGHAMRAARAADVDELLRLRHEAYAEDGTRAPELRLPDTREDVARDVATGNVLVVENATGDLVATLHARRIVQVRRLAVAPAARGAGLGGALLETALAQAARDGVEASELDAVADHPWMETYYARRGFEPRGTLTRADGTRWRVLRRLIS